MTSKWAARGIIQHVLDAQLCRSCCHAPFTDDVGTLRQRGPMVGIFDHLIAMTSAARFLRAAAEDRRGMIAAASRILPSIVRRRSAWPPAQRISRRGRAAHAEPSSALVYVAAASPLRVVEICMLDQGAAGASTSASRRSRPPSWGSIEHRQKMYLEALQIAAGADQQKLTFHGAFYDYTDVRSSSSRCWKPHPVLANAGTPTAARALNRLNKIWSPTRSAPRVRTITDRCRAASPGRTRRCSARRRDHGRDR